MSRANTRLLLTGISTVLIALASAACAAKPSLKECADMLNETARLACFDTITGTQYTQRSFLTRAWDLDGNGNPDSGGVRRLEPHRKNYVLIHHVSSINATPSSPAPLHAVTTPYDYQHDELKFQFSVKSEVGNYRGIHFLNFQNFRLWAAYTQQSYWQLFNSTVSSPFRETNYEPELIGTFGLNNDRGWKMLNLGLAHQSNGRQNPDSRSWNRLYLQGGWEWDDVYVLGRGWWRLPESAAQDDNPDITKYIGVADMEAHWSPDSEDEVILLLRSNMNLGRPRGYFELNWSTPVHIAHLSRLSLQFSSGYGSSLIDYNYNQTAFGVGLTFREW
ncbi:MAG: phospholipase A [Sideroxydans sp.]|nr:phospholipase A [Sideroxydans sp.]